MNPFIIDFFDCLDAKKVLYCHFKSNNNLESALAGVDDLDLLLSTEHTNTFLSVATEYGFRLALDSEARPTPFIYHFFGCDPNTGLLIHLHVYFKLVTGGSILKNHHIPLERLFLDNLHTESPAHIPIPVPEADLILFVIRKYIEQPSLIENYLFHKDYVGISSELEWLLSQVSDHKLRQLLATYVPEVSPLLFHRCIHYLRSRRRLFKRVFLGILIRNRFKQTCMSACRASLSRVTSFMYAFISNKLGLSRSGRYKFPGGAIYSFVGPEASGKSTISAETYKWLAERFNVYFFHLGKPPKSLLTLPLWCLVTIYTHCKKYLSFLSVCSATPEVKKLPNEDNLPHPLICILDSIDRRAVLKKVSRLRLQGAIVITDRYPCSHNGLDAARIPANGLFTKLLSRLEMRNYQGVPLPDIIFKLSVPLEVTLARNASRISPEPEQFVRSRYFMAMDTFYPNVRVVTLDTTVDVASTARVVRNHIWKS